MSTAPKLALPEPRARRVEPVSIDQRVVLRGSWGTYQALLEARGDAAHPRISYLDGVIELMAPSDEHEVDKKSLARLIETWSEEVGIGLQGIGSWTIKRKKDEAGAEPDECYTLVELHRGKPKPTRPDFAIEVVRTSGGIDKLEIYRRLGVPEVWYWKKGALSFYVLGDDGYVLAPRSRLVPALDPELLAPFVTMELQVDAIRALRRALAPKKRKRRPAKR